MGYNFARHFRICDPEWTGIKGIIRISRKDWKEKENRMGKMYKIIKKNKTNCRKLKMELTK